MRLHRLELSFDGICLSIDSVSVFLKVDHSDSVHAPVLYWVLILFDKVLIKVTIKAFPVSASKLVDLCVVYFGIGFYVEICDSDVMVGYPWYRYRVCYYCRICSED